MWFEEDMVGNAEAVELDVVEGLREEKRNLFAIFPISTAIQDGGKRKSVTMIESILYCHLSYIYQLLILYILQLSH